MIKKLVVKKYYVYVIGLYPRYSKTKKAKRHNPNYIEGKPCVYVGYTSKTPEERYKQHITGYINKKGHKLYSSTVLKFGYKNNGLRPRKYEKYNPLKSKEIAMKKEVELANQLRKKGYCVCQG
tara:strand:- start:5 stop:373 length:369 start_codon:yes stop_codon:yes gene_type:complete